MASKEVDDVSMPNPTPDPSLLPDSVLDCRVELNTKNVLSPEELHSVQCFRRAGDYIAAGPYHLSPFFCLLTPHPPFSLLAMIFLKENTLLGRELSQDDIKPRLLGHWGTCPGLIMVYAHLNRVIRNTGQDMLYVVGPGTCIAFISLRSPS